MRRWVVDSVIGYGKYAALAAIAAISYLGYTAYEQRQPYEWSGSVEMHAVNVGSRVGGRVKKVLVVEGQQVAAGDALVELEPGLLGAQKQMAEADVESAAAFLSKLENGARREEINQATSKVLAARAAAVQAAGIADHEAKELARTSTLVASGAVSQFEQDAATARAKSASSARDNADARTREDEAALRLLTSGTRPEEIRAARAQVEEAKAKLALIDAQLSELVIRSPSAARVEAVPVRTGDLLRADAHAITLLERGELYVRIYVPEPRLGNIKVGQEVPISVDSFPKRTFRGRVEHVNDVGEFTPRRLITTEERADEVFATRIELLEGDTELKAGMTAFIHIKK